MCPLKKASADCDFCGFCSLSRRCCHLLLHYFTRRAACCLYRSNPDDFVFPFDLRGVTTREEAFAITGRPFLLKPTRDAYIDHQEIRDLEVKHAIPSDYLKFGLDCLAKSWLVHHSKITCVHKSTSKVAIECLMQRISTCTSLHRLTGG